MDSYDCKYREVIPGIYGNEYTESYMCMVTNGDCNFDQCTLTEEEADELFNQLLLNEKEHAVEIVEDNSDDADEIPFQ